MRAEAFGCNLDEDLVARVEGGEDWCHRVSETAALCVVVGRGGRSESEVRVEACAADGVPVVRRRGGGGAVVLGPGCLVVSVAVRVGGDLEVGAYVNTFAQFLSRAVGVHAGLALECRGTGDVCVGDRKVVGSSLFRRRSVVFYQASVLHSLDLALVERYLAHPPKEPAYRLGRTHRAFLTTLEGEGACLGARELCDRLDQELAGLARSRSW